MIRVPEGGAVLALVLACAACSDPPPALPLEARPIDPARADPLPPPPPEHLMRQREQPQAPGYASVLARAPEAAPPEETPAADLAARAQALAAAALVPADVTGALLVARPAEALGGVGRWLRQLMAANALPGRADRFGDELRMLLGVNLASASALAAEGFDLDRPVAGWWRSGRWAVTLGTTDAARVASSLGGLIDRRGSIPGSACRSASALLAGRKVRTCMRGNEVVLGVVSGPDRVWLFGGPGTAAQHLGRLAAPTNPLSEHPDFLALPPPPTSASLFARVLPGIWGGRLHLGFEADAGGMRLTGSLDRGEIPLDEGSAPYAALENLESALVVRARVRRALPLLEDLGPEASLTWLCPRCDREALGRATRALTQTLTGEAAIMVTRLDPGCCGEGPTRPSDLFFLARHAWVAPVRDEAAAEAALEALVGVLARGGLALPASDGKSREAHRYSVPVDRRGAVHFGLAPGAFYVASDLEASRAVLASSADPGGGALSLRIDPSVIARDLTESAAPGKAAEEGLWGLALSFASSLGDAPPSFLSASPVGERIDLRAWLPNPPAPDEARGRR